MKLQTLLLLVWDHVRVRVGLERRYFLGRDSGTGYDVLVVMRRERDGSVSVVDMEAASHSEGDDE